MGYGGGTTAGPGYSHIGDHSEAVQIDYDPQRITYSQLLEVFWQNHRPTQRAWNRQYLNAVFFHDTAQQELALASKAVVEEKLGRRVHTEVIPLRSFTRAEEYHQKYLLKRHADLYGELKRIYPLHRDVVDSTAAARINGYVGGYGSAEQLQRDLALLGLSRKGRQALAELVRD